MPDVRLRKPILDIRSIHKNKKEISLLLFRFCQICCANSGATISRKKERRMNEGEVRRPR